MLTLPGAVQAWHTEQFSPMLKLELEALTPASLPLHLGVSQAGMVDSAPITVTVLASHDGGDFIRSKVGVFFTEIVINCGCGDDPMPINAYCELLLEIDKTSTEATVSVVED